MIKANELRIGNYYDHYGRIEKVSPNTIEEVWDAEREWCNPIPITEEWLLKFGAIKYEFDHKASQYRIDNMLFVIRENTFFDYGTDVKLQYVHQLQNLYFALTGEELVFTTEQ